MACSDLKKRIEFALKDLVKKHETFSLDEINTYLDPQNRMDFKEIFEIAHPFLCEMNASWHGSINPIGIIVSVNEPVVGKIHVVQNYFPDFMQEHEWSTIIELFKEKGDVKWVKILGGLLAEYIKCNPELKEVNFISPVPCEKEAVQRVGYDSNMLLANEIIKETGIPVIKVFSKTRKTNFCKIMSLNGKKEFIKGAFSLSNDVLVREKHILLLDDIMNSGTTVKQLAEMLKRSEAKKVDVLVLGKGVMA